MSVQGIEELWRELSHQAPKFADSCPGWAEAVASLTPETTGAESIAAEVTQSDVTFGDSLEAAISSLLLWAQGARLQEAEGTCPLKIIK